MKKIIWYIMPPEEDMQNYEAIKNDLNSVRTGIFRYKTFSNHGRLE